ncbi:hypothetical protein K7G98_30120, partial [Saccharothrix sp. MB29]|nr:hypothetical protein [Saccharothrix sp. MB29]
MSRIRLLGVVALSCLVSTTLFTGGAATAATGSGYQPEMVAALARTLGVDESAAVRRLDREADQQRRLADLTARGVQVDGAFFDGAGTLTVNADRAGAERARAAGLAARTPARGEAALNEVQARHDPLAARPVPTGVATGGVGVAA